MRAKQCSPEGEWIAAMRAGDFDRAWAINDSDLARRIAERTSKHEGPRHLQHIWRGEPLEGACALVRCYHGLGDTIQFIRYAPMVKAIAAETIVWAQPALIPILRTAPGIDRLEPLHDGVPELDYDVDVEVMELPHVFRSTRSSLPAAVPYLHAPRAALARDATLMVGLVARAGDYGTTRSVPLDALAPLAELAGVHVLLLHPTAGSEHAKPQREGAFEVATGTDTILGTASLMRALDLVVSPDTMPAHLAGALGVPVWTLLRRDADWRWLDHEHRCPWYPTMRLFRQERADDWASVVARVAVALAELRDQRLQVTNSADSSS
jgi:hypothetical protein